MARWLGRWTFFAALALFFGLRLAGAQGAVIQVADAWIRPAGAGENSTSAAYFTIKNTGPLEDTLVSASAAVAVAVELHEVVRLPDGVMRMQPRSQGFTAPARSEVHLKPGGYHVMLIGLKQAIQPGERVPLVLRFAKAGGVNITAVAAQRTGGGMHGNPAPSAHAAPMEPGHGAKK